jgi:hypothetical protein
MAENQYKYIGKSTWSVNEKTGKLEVNRIKNVKKTRKNAVLVKVHLDNGESITCTPDHRFMLRNGEYKEARHLRDNESLMPIPPGQFSFCMRVEFLTEKQDTYDIEMEGTPNFPLASGVFVHNSNFEATNEIIDQIAMTLKRARAINTSASNPNYDSKENPMGVTEDIFMPVWGDNVNNLDYSEIGGKPDIRWIVDIDALRNQLAVTLRTPLQLLGGYVEEASGSLGSDSIEQLDIGFARNARRLQRALKEGIKRICQIHLAYMNMDPDPALFEVNMSETSTAEEQVIINTFETGVGVIDQVIDLVTKVDKDVDEKKVFDYLNRKILKLEGFDLSKFQHAHTDIAEGIAATVDTWDRYPISNRDLVAYLPLADRMIREGVSSSPILSEKSEGLFCKRWKKNWKDRYGAVLVEATVGGAVPHNPLIKEKKE